MTLDRPPDRDRLDAPAGSTEAAMLLRLLLHETRTPLNAIRGFTELLLGGAAGPLSTDALSHLREIARAGSALEHALHLLHELAALEGEAAPSAAEPVDWRTILQGLGFSVGQGEGLPRVLGDPAAWQRAVAACRAYLLGPGVEGPLLAEAALDGTRGLELVLGCADMSRDGTGLVAIELARRIAARQGSTLALRHDARIAIAWPPERLEHHPFCDPSGRGKGERARLARRRRQSAAPYHPPGEGG